MAFGGKGVGRLENKVVFVPFTIPGEEVSIRITRQKKNYAEAELIALEQPSEHRVQPPCEYFGRCGGCAYQHVDYNLQLQLKSKQVEQILRRVGGINPVPMKPIIGAPSPYGYRSRIRVHVEDGLTGFYAFGSHELVDIAHCPIASSAVNRMLENLRTRGLRDGDYTLSESGTGRFFEQANPAVTKLMIDVVKGLLPQVRNVFVDAYCGAGLFAKAVAHQFTRTIGIEENQQAIEVARSSAGANEEYLCGDVAGVLAKVLRDANNTEATLLVDPPAVGLDHKVIETILSFQPSTLIYVSCNPATLARDLKQLGQAYALSSVTPLDMFAQTAEIEVVAHLIASGKESKIPA